jgi:pimeloyl-ACP methyl ester carboxylesterase
MEIAHYGNSHAYVFMNELSDRLIINIDGSGWDSTLGTKNKRRWTTTKNGAQLLQVLGDKYTFFIPEKFRREPGLTYYEDMGDRADYTADNLLNCYIESINGYLSEHSFSSIILIGTSEGAMLLPLIYDRMNNKDMVKALVSISFGGLSLYESYSILYIYPDLHSDYKAMYQYFLLAFEPGKTDYPDSFKEDVFGITYRWFNSFKDIKPFDYYKNINIPVLFVHGDYDYNIPVESTTFIQENLSEKPFTYKYFQWAHQPEKYSDIITFRNEVAEWVIQNDLAME